MSIISSNIYFENDFVKISYSGSKRDGLCLVAFTGVGHSLGGVNVQREEFLSQCSIGTVIWVTDKQRT